LTASIVRRILALDVVRNKRVGTGEIMASRQKPPLRGEGPPALRFEATLGSANYAKAIAATSELGLDRLPDVDRKVRVLLSPDDARKLLERGFEVHLLAPIPVGPLEKSLIMTDRQSQEWIESQLKGIPRKGSK